MLSSDPLSRPASSPRPESLRSTTATTSIDFGSGRCGDRGGLVVERNASQASLISGPAGITLFRESSTEPGLHYRNGEMLLTLWGDNLTLEQGRNTLRCIRTDQA